MKHYYSSEGIVWFNEKWMSSDTPIISTMSSGSWAASTVFDGLRAFNSAIPDADLHCQRLINSSIELGHQPSCSWEQVFTLCWEGIHHFSDNVALYIRPMIWADRGFIAPDPDSTKLAITIFPMSMPQRSDTMSAMITDLIRPLPQTAPTKSKAAGLYPNSGLAILKARQYGFDNAILLDVYGNITEFSASNLFVVKNNKVITPADNGSFLCGITRKRAMILFNEIGIECCEGRVTKEMIYDADEVISTGNYAKIMTVNQIDKVHYHKKEVYYALYDAYHLFAEMQIR